MTVGELRKALEGVPDEMEVVIGYDGGTQSSGSAEDAKVFTLKGSFREYGDYFLVPEDQ